jgi:hypothetical protein
MLRRDRWTNGMTWRQILVALSPGFVGSGIVLVLWRALWRVA